MPSEHQGKSASLAELYSQHKGKVSDKWSSYLDFYDTQFEKIRDKPVRILEIGVQNGGSLEIWAKYFPNFRCIVGCDIDERCRGLSYASSDISVVVGDAMSANVFAQVVSIEDEFDIIIDDGSHHSKDIIGAFSRYFPLLSDGGLFVVEDLHCSYRPYHGGGLARKGSAIEFFKKLVDVSNYSHWKEARKIHRFLGLKSEQDRSLTHAELLMVDSVYFRDSMCLVTKSAVIGPERLGTHVVAGEAAFTTDNHVRDNGLFMKPPKKHSPSYMFVRRLFGL